MIKYTIEVKTTYHIGIQIKDFAKIFAEAKSDPSRLSSEFSEFDLGDTTIGNLDRCFKSLWQPYWSAASEQRCRDLQYIVRKLGFDGIENYGCFSQDGRVYKMVVYNRGADI